MFPNLVAWRANLKSVQLWHSMCRPSDANLILNLSLSASVPVSEVPMIVLTDADFFPAEIAEGFRQHNGASLAKGIAAMNQEWVQDPDGRKAPMGTRKCPLRDPEGGSAWGVSQEVKPPRRRNSPESGFPSQARRPLSTNTGLSGARRVPSARGAPRQA